MSLNARQVIAFWWAVYVCRTLRIESSYSSFWCKDLFNNNTSPVLRLHSLATQSLEAVIRYLIVFDIVILASKHFKGDVRRLSLQHVNLVKYILLWICSEGGIPDPSLVWTCQLLKKVMYQSMHAFNCWVMWTDRSADSQPAQVWNPRSSTT